MSEWWNNAVSATQQPRHRHMQQLRASVGAVKRPERRVGLVLLLRIDKREWWINASYLPKVNLTVIFVP